MYMVSDTFKSYNIQYLENKDCFWLYLFLHNLITTANQYYFTIFIILLFFFYSKAD